MKVLLIIPRYGSTDKVNYNYAFPLSLAYISSILKKGGHEVDCLNLNHLEGKIEELISTKLNDKTYRVVCTGHTGIGLDMTKKIIDAVHNHKTSPQVVIGGHIITNESELMFNALNPDFAVIGEGEITILELLNCLEKREDLKKVKGIGYRDKEGKLYLTEKRESIQDINSLPFPDLDSLGFEEKIKNLYTNSIYSPSQNILE